MNNISLSNSTRRRRRNSSRNYDPRTSKKYKGFLSDCASESDFESDLECSKMAQPQFSPACIAKQLPSSMQIHSMMTSPPQPSEINQSTCNMNMNPMYTAGAPVPTSGISDHDIMKIGICVKNLIMSEVTQLVNDMVDPLQMEINKLRSENLEMKQKIDDIEQYSRRPLVRFNGIPENGQTENTTDLILEVAVKAKLDLKPEDIIQSHRVGPRSPDKTRQIIVRLTGVEAKKRLLSTRKNLRTEKSLEKISVNEDLTKMRSKVAYEARQLKKNKIISQTWTSDGKIFVKDFSEKIHAFTSEIVLHVSMQIMNVREKNLIATGYSSLDEWLSNPENIYIGRDMEHHVQGAKQSKWCNPFPVKKYGRELSLMKYEEHVRKNKDLLISLRELIGKNLGCWCHPKQCHGHILIKLINENIPAVSVHVWNMDH